METSLLQPLEAALRSTSSSYCGRASHLFTKKLKQSIQTVQREDAHRWRTESPRLQVTTQPSSTCGAGEACRFRGLLFCFFKRLSLTSIGYALKPLWPSRDFPVLSCNRQFLIIQTIRLSDLVQTSYSHFIHFSTGKKKDKYITKPVLFRMLY